MLSRRSPILFSCVALALANFLPFIINDTLSDLLQRKDATVLILGGGVSGIIAAKALTEQGINDFKVIEARDELGGRLYSETFGEPGSQAVIEVFWSGSSMSFTG